MTAVTPSSNPSDRHISLVLPGLAGGGTERTVLTVARGLLALGHKVDIVLFEPEFAHAGEVPAEARLFVLSDQVISPPPRNCRRTRNGGRSAGRSCRGRGFSPV